MVAGAPLFAVFGFAFIMFVSAIVAITVEAFTKKKQEVEDANDEDSGF